MLSHILAAVPPEIAGMPTWALNGLTVGSLVSMVLIGLMTSKLWTKRQVDELVKQHEREVQQLTTQQEREMKAVTNRYELHLTRTVELWTGRCDDARSREHEWSGVAQKWQAVAEMLSQGIEPMQEQSETVLRILQAWQNESRRKDLDRDRP